ncbi:MAG: hypothetical protein EP348_00330 [Alphaproteobacteria bacterium]|nr:MAG: hypothetical protein EP348_00330 [Alphaproteobacteria bacterium]
MTRARHPDKHIESAVRYAEANGWTVKMSNGHAWGRLYRRFHDREGCIITVWSTPRNPQNHAKAIMRSVGRCPHEEE